MTKPETEWNLIREKPPGILQLYLGQIIWLAAIPALGTYYGTTQVGWSLPGSSEIVKLTPESAAWMAGLAWLAMLAGVGVMGWAVQWMSQTFGTKPNLTQSTAFSCYTAFPLFLAGICGLYPSLWLALIAGTLAASASAWLLYTGLPTFMNIPKEQGFIYASSILCIGLVVLVALMITTVIFWGMGIGPEYISVIK
ncbi:YIP1 family protein [Endozoicomonas sp. Mp262]|uniref:Yip1 family protein n=1 Tax=Endozoicomonas sp. Mp262 TaxID=2919499 RepID=UPI0021DB449F